MEALETGEVERGEVETGEVEGEGGRKRGRPLMDGVPVHLKLPPALVRRAEAWAAQSGATRASVLRLALDAGLDVLGAPWGE